MRCPECGSEFVLVEPWVMHMSRKHGRLCQTIKDIDALLLQGSVEVVYSITDEETGKDETTP